MTFCLLGFSLAAMPSRVGRTVDSVVVGRAVKWTASDVQVVRTLVDRSHIAVEIKRVHVAKEKAMTDLQQVRKNLQDAVAMEQAATGDALDLIDVHLMLLADDAWLQGVEQLISQQCYNAQWAVSAQFVTLANQFEVMHDPYMRERKRDVEQVAERVLKSLQVSDSVCLSHQTHQHESCILVAHDLSPVDLMRLKQQQKFTGFILEVGSTTSHTAIVARGMDVPVILGIKHAARLIRQDDDLILDVDLGTVIVEPTPNILAQYQTRRDFSKSQHSRSKALPDTPDIPDMPGQLPLIPTDVFAPDGEVISLLANIEHPDDAVAALAAGAHGIGLFRTEFLFMGRQQLPTEDEQYAAYSQVVQTMQGRSVTIRTLDIGADKPLDVEQAHIASPNPALGLRAIRWCLTKPDIFLIQLRALLRASVHGRLNILIPMLTNAQEIQQCLQLMAHAKAQLTQARQLFGTVQLGAMIEVPAAALCAPMFLKDFDFLSIGSNDLIQYTLAADRMDESVAHLYDAHHPAVQYLIERVIEQCRAAGKPVSLCGDMAIEKAHTQTLLRMGLRLFSMPPLHLESFREHVKRLALDHQHAAIDV